MGLTADILRPLLGLAADTSGGWQTLPAHATYLRPGAARCPAVLYCHAHGGAYELGRHEVTEGARWLSSAPAPALLEAGYAVLCVDMPGFGDRRSDGAESALAKAGLWKGKPLFGQMLAEQLAAFDWLARQPDIEAGRIVTMGTSMGAALAMWTAAIEPRVAAVVQLCMLADIEHLIANGTHDRHGPYLTVPGLLNHGDMGDVAAMVAPRPQFIAHGAQDHLTPEIAREAALETVRRAYGPTGALTTCLSETSGHCETPQIRDAAMGFLADLPITPI